MPRTKQPTLPDADVSIRVTGEMAGQIRLYAKVLDRSPNKAGKRLIALGLDLPAVDRAVRKARKAAGK